MKKSLFAAALLAATPALAADPASGAGPVAPPSANAAPAASKPAVKAAPSASKPAAKAAPASEADSTAKARPALDPEVAALVAKVQAFYEKSQGFDTRFEQAFVQAGVPSRLGGSSTKGRMRFRKPEGAVGPLMRWDYEDGRILLLVKDGSWAYDPDTKQATEYKVDPAQLSAAVTFMWGKGKLVDEFDITRASRNLGTDGVALELTPRKASSFTKVFLVVDPEKGSVGRSIVIQSNGSENDLTFREATVNSSVTKGDFDPATAFPAGTARIKAAIPGQ